jgi:hypothetical protein
MDASDMLDVLHYYFEEDSRYSTAEEAEAVSDMRLSLYRQMYDVQYKYAVKTKSSSSRNTYASGTDFNDLPFDETDMQVKPFVPTTFDPEKGVDSNGVLDGPLG